MGLQVIVCGSHREVKCFISPRGHPALSSHAYRLSKELHLTGNLSKQTSTESGHVPREIYACAKMLKKNGCFFGILDVFEELIRHRILRGDTHAQVCHYFRSLFSSCQGLSAKSVRRFCSARGIHYRSNLSEIGLDELTPVCF